MFFATIQFAWTKCDAQSLQKLDFTKAYTLGQITLLPDTIFLFDNKDMIKDNDSYTEIERSNGCNYILTTWDKKHSSTVDPTPYKKNLKMVTKDNRVKLMFGKKQKVYKVDKSGHIMLFTKTGQ